MKILLIGFGTVGQGFIEILQTQADTLRARYGFVPQVVAVVTRTRGSLYDPQGLDLGELLRASEQGDLAQYPQQAQLTRGWDALTMIRKAEADVMIEATPSDLQTGQPALQHVAAAFEVAMDVVLANKGPVALAYADLQALAARTGRLLRCEATVMAGTPAIALGLEGLAGAAITRIRGILNGTTNYMLTQMEQGQSYADALQQAQAMGYAEADPTADVDGWDAVGKVLILASVIFGVHLRIQNLRVRGIRDITIADIQAAQAANERYRLIAEVTPQGGSVQPLRLPITDPLAQIQGATNAITYTSALLGDVTLIGPGAGRTETGFALLADLLSIHAKRR